MPVAQVTTNAWPSSWTGGASPMQLVRAGQVDPDGIEVAHTLWVHELERQSAP